MRGSFARRPGEGDGLDSSDESAPEGAKGPEPLEVGSVRKARPPTGRAWRRRCGSTGPWEHLVRAMCASQSCVWGSLLSSRSSQVRRGFRSCAIRASRRHDAPRAGVVAASYMQFSCGASCALSLSRVSSTLHTIRVLVPLMPYGAAAESAHCMSGAPRAERRHM